MADPTSGIAWEFHVALYDQVSPGKFKANPTIASGDFKLSKDGGVLTNLTTLPSVAPAGSVLVKVQLSAAELTGCSYIEVVAIDQAGDEWADSAWHWPVQMAGGGGSGGSLLLLSVG